MDKKEDLKTLKDIHTKAGMFEDSDVDDFKVVLKQEAIKWIMNSMIMGNDIFGDEEWMKFFNITEDDLKEVKK